MKRAVFSLLFSIPLLAASLPLHAEKGLWEQTRQSANKLWESTREGAADAADWSADKAKKGWEKGKKGTADAAAWSGEKTESGWNAAKRGADNLWQRAKTAINE